MANKTIEKNGITQGKADRLLNLMGSAVEGLKTIVDSVDSANKSFERKKTTDTDNTVKISKVETEAKKEEYRHDEAIARIELEYKKLVDDASNGELKWSIIQNMVQKLIEESNKLNSMDNSVFLSEEARTSRDDLHRTMLELSKEIIRA